MPWKSFLNRNRLPALLLVALPAALSACAQLNDPFKDSAAYSHEEMTTPSADAYLHDQHEPLHVTARGWNASDVYYENGTVTHWPLWFEDPFEDKGNDVTHPNDRDAPDNRFAWTAADYLHIGYGPGRMLLNLFGLPFSAVVQPPGWVMSSDGRISRGWVDYNHDSTYARKTDEPPDYNDLNRIRFMERADTDHGEYEPPPATEPAGAP